MADSLTSTIESLEKNQDKFYELFPQFERYSSPIQSFEELSTLLGKQNEVMLERMVKLNKKMEGDSKIQRNRLLEEQYKKIGAEKQELTTLVTKLSNENEYHVGVIEKLKKELELYKSKSPVELDKKLAQLDTDAKKDAHKWKLENERLTELLNFKEIQLKEKLQEVDKLRIVIRAEADAEKFPSGNAGGGGGKKLYSPQKKLGNLEKKLEDLSQSKKIEFKLLLPQVVPDSVEEASKDDRDLDRVLAMNKNDLFQSLLTVSKSIDHQIREEGMREVVEEQNNTITELQKQNDKFKAKILQIQSQYEEECKQRGILENQINQICLTQENFKSKYDSLVDMVDAHSKRIQAAPQITIRSDEEIRPLKIGESPIYSAKGSFKGEPDWQRFELPKEIDLQEEVYEERKEAPQSQFRTAQDLIEYLQKLFNDKQFNEATDLWKEAEYSCRGLDPMEALKLMKIAIKVRDKQVDKMKKEIHDVDSLKNCIELKNDEILELMADYETLKSKFILSQTKSPLNITQQIDILQEQIQELTEQLSKQKAEVEQKEKEIQFLKQTIQQSEQSATTTESINHTFNNVIHEKDKKITLLENSIKMFEKEVQQLKEFPSQWEKNQSEEFKKLQIEVEDLRSRNKLLTYQIELQEKTPFKSNEWDTPIRLQSQTKEYEYYHSEMNSSPQRVMALLKKKTEEVEQKENTIEHLKRELLSGRELVKRCLAGRSEEPDSHINKVLYDNYTEIKSSYDKLDEEKKKTTLMAFDLSFQTKTLFQLISPHLKDELIEFNDPFTSTISPSALGMSHIESSPPLIHIIHSEIINQQNLQKVISKLVEGRISGIDSFTREIKPERQKWRPEKLVTGDDGTLMNRKEAWDNLESSNSAMYTARQNANKIYKEYYQADRTPDNLERMYQSSTFYERKLEEKNNKFRELFTLVESVLSSFERILKDHKVVLSLNETKPKFGGTIGGVGTGMYSDFDEMRRTNEEDLARIIDLETEVKALKSEVHKQSSKESLYKLERFLSSKKKTIPPYALVSASSSHRWDMKEPMRKLYFDKEKDREREKEIYKEKGESTKINYLSQKIKELEKQITRLEDRISTKEENILILQEQIDQKDEEREKIIQVNEELTSEIKSLDDQCKDLKLENYSLTQNIQKINMQLDSQVKSRNIAQEAQDTIEHLTLQSEQLKIETEEITKLNQSLKVSLERSEEEIRALKKSLLTEEERAKATIALKEQEIDEMKRSLKIMNENEESSQDKITSLNQKINSLLKDSQKNQSEKHELRTILSRLNELKSIMTTEEGISLSPSKLQYRELSPSRFSSANTFGIIDQLKEKLLQSKKKIISLQKAVNSLQAERQLMYQKQNAYKTKIMDYDQFLDSSELKNVYNLASSPRSTTSPFSLEVPSTEVMRKLKAEIEGLKDEKETLLRQINYQLEEIDILKKKPEKTEFVDYKLEETLKTLFNLFKDDLNEGLSKIAIILESENERVRMEDLKLVFHKCITMILNLKDELSKKSSIILEMKHNNELLKDDIDRERRRLHTMEEDKMLESTLKEKKMINEIDDLIARRSTLENDNIKLAHKLKEAYNQIEAYEKKIDNYERMISKMKNQHESTYKNLRDDVERIYTKEMDKRVQEVKEDVIMQERKKERYNTEAEINRLNSIIQEYRIALDDKSKKFQDLILENQHLEQYKEKANVHINNLLNNIKKEQEKQKKLSYDLELVTQEFRHQRMKNDDLYS